MKKISGFRSLRILFGFLLLALVPTFGFAQAARLRLDGLNQLSDKAAEVNDVTLDGATLQLASAFAKSQNGLQNDMNKKLNADQVQEIIKNLKGIYIKNFKFKQPNAYSQADVDSIRNQLAAPGWTKIVENQEKESGTTNEVCIMQDGDKVVGLAILSAEPKELSIVNIVGQIDLTKLGMLAGNFGIPKSLLPGKDSTVNAPGRSAPAPAPNPKKTPPPAGSVH